MNWQNYPFIRLVIPFALGMVGANLFASHMDLPVLFILCCAVLAFLFFFIPKQKDTYKDGKFGVVAMALALLVGMTLYTGKHRSIERGIPADTTFCQGILTEPPIEKARSWALNLKQENGTHILLYIGKRHLPSSPKAEEGDCLDGNSSPFGEAGRGLEDGRRPQLGDTILAHLTHFTPTNTCPNDTFKTYYTYLFHQGVCATAYTLPHQWTLHPRQGTPSLLHRIQSLQPQLHRIYDDHGIRGDAGSIIEAMTIGRKADLSSATRQAYATSGVSHVLALSGFHVGIIAMMLQVLFFGKFLPLRWQWLSNLLILIALWGYALMTGMPPSLVRATLMFSIFLLCQFFSRDAFSPNTCALAFFIMLCINPLYLNDIGFQLSFIAVGSIGIFGKDFINLSTPPNNLVHHIWLIPIIAISLICSVFTAPLVAYHFGQLPLFSLIGNLALFCFVYIIMWGTLLWWLFLWCTPINHALTVLLTWAADTMNTLTATISSLPHSSIEWHPSALTVIGCYILLLALAYQLNIHKPKHT